MSEHTALVERFYESFGRRDWAGMVACYHPEVHFTDPVFDLHGESAGLMWRMLCTNAKDFSLKASGIRDEGTSTVAHWDANYLFSGTGRHVLNQIDARFEFRDGLIVRHVDSFDFWRWSRQALGAPGWLLGWSGTLRDKVRAKAAGGLEAFRQKVAQGC